MENTVTLPAFVIASLYKNTLVEVSPAAESGTPLLSDTTELIEETDSPASTQPLYLGGNQKGIAIILKEENSLFINDNDLAFLSNILNACGFTLQDISIFNHLKKPVAFGELKETHNISYFLLFGVEPMEAKMPFQIPAFQVQQYAGATIIAAPPLNEMNLQNATATTLKRQLWESLQRCFDIKPKR